MAIIYGNTKPSKKVNRKPGWKKEEEEYAKWLAKHQPTKEEQKRLRAAQKAVGSKPSTRPSKVVVLRPTSSSASSHQASSSISTLPKEQVKIHDPKVLYKDNPEMLERELRARERKFLTAPAFNKGGDQLVTPEMLKDIMAGGGRRRS